MKNRNNTKAYRIAVEWSGEDQCYIARVPAFRYVAAHGDRPEKAVKEVQIALEGVLESMEEHGDPIPAPDQALDEIRRFEPILNKSALARIAGMNKHTLATKLKRGTRFSDEEARRIKAALELVQDRVG